MSESTSSAPVQKPSRTRLLVWTGVVLLIVLAGIDGYTYCVYKWGALSGSGDAAKPLYKFEPMFGFGVCIVLAWVVAVVGFVLHRRPGFDGETRDGESDSEAAGCCAGGEAGKEASSC